MAICQHGKLYAKGLAMGSIDGRIAQAVQGLQQDLHVTGPARLQRRHAWLAANIALSVRYNASLAVTCHLFRVKYLSDVSVSKRF